MSIKLGTQNISAIYKGDTEIVKRYKGTQVIYESSVFLPYSYEYLYNSLIPETISGKGVKNKAKVSKIYANGVIENQLVQNGNFESSSGWNANNGTISISNNKATITPTNASSSVYHSVSDLPTGHTYLFNATITMSASDNVQVRFGWQASTKYVQDLSTTTKTTVSLIINITTTGNIYAYVYINGNTNLNSYTVENFQVIDLTQMFPFDTPTSLSDVRVQAILNRGYIAYNTGTYKGTDIREFSSLSKNLFTYDTTKTGEQNVSISGTEQDKIFTSTGDFGRVGYKLTGLIKGRTYLVKTTVIKSGTRTSSIQLNSSTTWNGDLGMLFNSGTAGTYDRNITFVAPNDYIYVGFYVSAGTYQNDILEVKDFLVQDNSVSDTSYKPHQTFSPLSFIYQGNGALNSHDTFEITSTEYVITKNVSSVDMGTLNWSTASYGFYLTLSSAKPQTDLNAIGNIVCSAYITQESIHIANYKDKEGIAIDEVSHIQVRDTSKSSMTAADFKTAMSGVYLYYELATPQVIRIPKKHLGIVDLGSLSFTSNPNAYGEIQSDDLGGIIKPIPNANTIFNGYCSNFISTYANDGYHSTTKDNLIWLWQESVGTGGRLTLLSKSFIGLSKQQVSEKLSGTYLFYETENEVSDIADTIGIEKGGTITSNSQVLPDVDFNIKCK